MARKVFNRGGGLLLELAVVFFGVLVALGFDEWREEQQRDALLNNVLSGLLAETRQNLAALEREVDYHIRMRDVFGEYAARFDQTQQWDFPQAEFEGMRLAQLSDAAYESGLMTGLLPLIDFDTLLLTSAVYNKIEKYRRDNDQYGLVTLQTGFQDGSRYLRILNFHFAALADNEKKLARELERLEAQLEQFSDGESEPGQQAVQISEE